MKILESFNDFVDQIVNEKKSITLKRRYTERYPEVTAGKNARIRNSVIEAVADGKLSRDEFDAILKEMTKDNARWMRRNAKYFNVSEDGVSLSKFGKKILNGVELNESELNESTRSHVGVIRKNGDIESVYVHYDGYPDEEGGVGRTLKNHYSDPKKINKLIDLGKFGISSLDMDIKGGNDHSFAKPAKGQTVFYGRDRGQNTKMTELGKDTNVERYLQNLLNDVEYVYLWDEVKSQWVYAGKETRKQLELLESSSDQINELGSSDISIMNKQIHKELRSPKTMPSPFDQKLRNAAEDAVDRYYGDSEEYESDIDELINDVVMGYLMQYFGKEFKLMQKMFEDSEVTESRFYAFYKGQKHEIEAEEPYGVRLARKILEENRMKLQTTDDQTVNEAEVESDADFKEYAFTVLKNAFGDDFDEAKAQEVVDGILDKCGDDYGACIGMLTSSLG